MASKAQKNKQMVRLVKDNNSIIIPVVLLLVAFIGISGFGKGFYNAFVFTYTALEYDRRKDFFTFSDVV